MTTQADIKRWFKEGVKRQSTHMIVVCDSFDHTDYPVYVERDQDVHYMKKKSASKEMQKVMEIYNLKKDMYTQLDQARSFNY